MTVQPRAREGRARKPIKYDFGDDEDEVNDDEDEIIPKPKSRAPAYVSDEESDNDDYAMPAPSESQSASSIPVSFVVKLHYSRINSIPNRFKGQKMYWCNS